MSTAIILAAGEGTRLQPLTDTKPKVMLPVAGKPILHHVLDSLTENHITDIGIVIGYKKEAILDSLTDYTKAKLTYYTQDKQLGTAHALLQAHDHNPQEPFLVLPGDNIIDSESIHKLYSIKEEYGILINKTDTPAYYGVVDTRSDDTLKSLTEKPKQNQTPQYVSTGIYKFPPTIFPKLKSSIHKGENTLSDLISTLLNDNISIHSVNAETWYDVTYPWDLLKLNETMLRPKQHTSGTIENNVTIKGPVSIGEKTRIGSGSYLVGPLSIGSHCEIGPNTVIYPTTTISDFCVIDSNCEIRNSIIMDNTHIGSGSYLSHSIISENCNLRHGFSTITGPAIIHRTNGCRQYSKVGALVGSDSLINNQVVVCAGKIIGRNCTVAPLCTISEDIPTNTKVM